MLRSIIAYKYAIPAEPPKCHRSFQEGKCSDNELVADVIQRGPSSEQDTMRKWWCMLPTNKLLTQALTSFSPYQMKCMLTTQSSHSELYLTFQQLFGASQLILFKFPEGQIALISAFPLHSLCNISGLSSLKRHFQIWGGNWNCGAALRAARPGA